MTWCSPAHTGLRPHDSNDRYIRHRTRRAAEEYRGEDAESHAFGSSDSPIRSSAAELVSVKPG